MPALLHAPEGESTRSFESIHVFFAAGIKVLFFE